MKSRFYVLLAGIILCGTGCFKVTSSATTPPPTAAMAKTGGFNRGAQATYAAQDTCVTVPTGGKLLDDGSPSITAYLSRDQLGLGDQAIYVVGTFPTQYSINDEFTTPTKQELLKKATAWQWTVGPSADADGNMTKLKIEKEVLNPDNNQAYVTDITLYNYGDDMMVTDSDGHLLIKCNIPVNGPMN